MLGMNDNNPQKQEMIREQGEYLSRLRGELENALGFKIEDYLDHLTYHQEGYEPTVRDIRVDAHRVVSLLEGVSAVFSSATPLILYNTMSDDQHDEDFKRRLMAEIVDLSETMARLKVDLYASMEQSSAPKEWNQSSLFGSRGIK